MGFSSLTKNDIMPQGYFQENDQAFSNQIAKIKSKAEGSQGSLQDTSAEVSPAYTHPNFDLTSQGTEAMKLWQIWFQQSSMHHDNRDVYRATRTSLDYTH